MHRIGIISDTHGLLRPEVAEGLRGCERILHGGDINSPEILEALQKIAPTFAVRGNNDKEWAKNLPETLSINLYGLHFFMVHNKKHIPKEAKSIDVIIYGHSHKYEEKHNDGRFLLNPGSCGPRRFNQPVTFAVLEIGEDGSVRVEKIEIAHQVKERGGIGRNRKKVVQAVMRDTDRGRSVREIAVRNGIDNELAQQICRLYLTHPGINAEGILEKMGM